LKNGNGAGIDTRFHDSDSDTPYCHPSCSYTVGEEIDIHVRFDRPVVVEGTEISLISDVGDNIHGNEAVFVPSRSTEYELVFVYTVGPNHSSNGASLLCLLF